jgi:hypothetical protein
VLKEKGVLSFNRKACIDLSKTKSVTFSCYDSITVKDFTKVNITENEAKIIIAELVKREIVEKISENSAYRLKIKFDEINQVQLPSCPVYENAVKALLSACFTYTIALQRMEEKSLPVHIQLMPKSHRSLVLELLKLKIIKPTRVTNIDKQLEEKLKSIYSETTSKGNFIHMLSQSQLFPEGCAEELFKHLVTKGWITQRKLFPKELSDHLVKIESITQYNPIQYIQENVIRDFGGENIIKTGLHLAQDSYRINSPAERQLPLSFSHEASHKNEPIEGQSIDKTVNKFLDNYS